VPSVLPGQDRILIGGSPTVTLQERLRPELKAVIVGFNPSPVSVAAGHYYQGKLGKRLWSRLEGAAILQELQSGKEDDTAFDQGFGFADLIRRPTARADQLTGKEKAVAATDLVDRLKVLPDRPRILFVFVEVSRLASGALNREGFATLNLPAPYAARAVVDLQMAELARSFAARIYTNRLMN